MENELIALPAETGTALTLIATGVIVPAFTALFKYEGMPKWLKRVIPIALSVIAAAIIVVLAGGGSFAEQLTTWLLITATVVGIAQAVYSAMPAAWKRLETATHRATRPAGETADHDRPQRPDTHT